MKTYIIADNQELTSKGIETLVSTHAKGSHILFAATRAELTNLLGAHPQSVVIVDYTLFDFPDENSLLSTATRFPKTIWLILSDELSSSFIHKVAHSSQQVGILFKSNSTKTIDNAIAAAAEGRRFICQRAMEMILEQYVLTDSNASLTETEMLILKTIAQGKTTKEIAAERCCSIHTINAHRKNIFRKLNVNTAHEAVKFAFRAGLVDPSEFYG